jgi:putative flippase GtrA
MSGFLSTQFLLFLATGGTAAAINFASRFVFNQWLSYSTSIILAYLLGMLTAFFLARCFVFKTLQPNAAGQFTKFALVNVLAVAQTWLISMGLAYYVLPAFKVVDYAREIAHAVGIVVPVFSSYWGHKHWSFKERL